MPIKSKAQGNLMRAVAHSPSFAKKVGIPRSVGKKFMIHKADGGPVESDTKPADRRPQGQRDMMFRPDDREEDRFIKQAPKHYGPSPRPPEENERRMREAKEGGVMRASAMKKVFAGKETPAEERKEKQVAKKAGMSYKAAEKKFEGEKYAKGGGVESKGKTKGKMVKMKYGGTC